MMKTVEEHLHIIIINNHKTIKTIKRQISIYSKLESLIEHDRELIIKTVNFIRKQEKENQKHIY